MTALTHVGLLLLAAASHTVQAKFFKTKFEDCGKCSMMEKCTLLFACCTSPASIQLISFKFNKSTLHCHCRVCTTLINYDDIDWWCNTGSILNIEDALAGSVVMTAPFNRRTGRHILGKVTNTKLQSAHLSVNTGCQCWQCDIFRENKWRSVSMGLFPPADWVSPSLASRTRLTER